MMKLLSGINATLIILAAGYVFFIIRYQYQTKSDEKSIKLSRYAWSISVAATGIFISSIIFFIFCCGFIHQSSMRNLSIIPRCLFVMHLVIAYSILDWKLSRIIVPVAILVGIAIFVARTLL